MPQDHLRSESQHGGNFRGESSRHERGDRARSENQRSDKPATGDATGEGLREMGAKNVKAGLEMQKEMFDTLQDIGRDWFTRATSEAELAFNLPKRLNGARTVPDALSAYQEWLGEWLEKCREDSRSLVSDGQKIMATGARCLNRTSPPAHG